MNIANEINEMSACLRDLERVYELAKCEPKTKQLCEQLLEAKLMESFIRGAMAAYTKILEDN
jgi:hypothetical protein